MPTPGSVQLQPDSTGQRVDALDLTTTEGAVIRQVVSLGDPNTAASYAAIGNAVPAGTEFGLLVRQVGETVVNPTATTRGDFFPSPGFQSSVLGNGEVSEISIDSVGSLLTRGAVVTDEGSMSDEFSGVSLANTAVGACSFTNGSTTVTGSGFFLTVNKLAWIKVITDGEANWNRVLRVVSDNELLLASNYAGATATATAHTSQWPSITGAGGSIAVANSLATITSGTTSGSQTGIYRQVDYSPLIMETHFAVPTRQVNQEVKIGFQDSKPGQAINHQAMVIFSGTVNTTVIFRTGWSSAAADIRETSVTLPAAAVTTANNVYRIEIGPTGCTLSINGVPSVTHKRGTPNPYMVMFATCYVNNTGTPGLSNAVALDRMTILNTDILQATSSFFNDPAPMKGAGVAGTPDTGVLSVQGVASGTPMNSQPTTSAGAALFANAAAVVDSAANPTSTQVWSYPMSFNGATWDRQRGNVNVTMGDTGAKTVTFNGATQTNYSGRGAKIMVLFGAVTGTTPTIAIQLQISPDGGTTWLNYGPGIAAFTPASGNTALIEVYPTNESTSGASPGALTTGATQALTINATLPRTWRLAYTIGGTTPSITLTNGYAAYTL